jgi:hypothetical protein
LRNKSSERGAKKLKTVLKEKYMHLQSLEQEIDNKDVKISRLESLKEIESESGSEMSMR